MTKKQDNQENVAIKVSNVSKDFVLPHESSNSIKSKLINFNKRGYEMQHALKDVSFEVKKGEFFGIVGRNGSGKSTLLKILAGIYKPSAGNVEVNGKLTPFIELGVGFNPELSGRDNVFLNGALLGFNRKEMSMLYDDIVEFAELERFMDQKLKNYSSGMQVRLAFSIAIRANTDILVLDEVLAVGDSNFQRKCFDYFRELKSNNKTIVLVTHDMSAVERFCDRALIIDNSKIAEIGSPLEITKIYNEINTQAIKNSLDNEQKSTSHVTKAGLGVTESHTTDEDGKQKTVFQPKENIVINTALIFNESIKDASVILKVSPKGSAPIVNVSTRMLDTTISGKKGETLNIAWSMNNILNNGAYTVSVQTMASDRVTVLDDLVEGGVFEVVGWKYPYSTIHPDIKLTLGSKA